MTGRHRRFVPVLLSFVVLIWLGCSEEKPGPVAPDVPHVPQLIVLPAGGGSGAIFTTTPDGSIVNENVRYDGKNEVYLDGGPPPNAPASAAGLDEGFYVFQITDPPGKLLLSVDPARCRIVHVNSQGVIDQLMAPTDNTVMDPDGNTTVDYTAATTDRWSDDATRPFDYSVEPCHMQEEPDGAAGTDPVDVPDFFGLGRHDTNTDADHGADAGAIVVQMMPYGTTPNPGGVYKAWMTPIQAYVDVKNADLNEIPDDKNGRVRPHDCPDFCADADPGFQPSHRYTKTDNFKVTEQFPAEITVRKFHDLNGNGIWDDDEPEIGVDECVVPDGADEGDLRDCSDAAAGGWPFDYTEPVDGGTMTQTEYTPETFVAGFPGTYTAEEFHLAGWTQSASRLDWVYLDPVQKSVSVEVEAVAPGETHEIVFGNWYPATKTGMKFWDVNKNHVKDSGEPGLEGWVIELFGTAGDGSSIAVSTTTDANGVYEFTDVPPGTYTVCEVLSDSGWGQSAPASGADCTAFDAAHGHLHGPVGYAVTLDSYETDAGNDFGNIPPEGCTPGYWKQSQHFDSWVATGYDPTDPLVGLFAAAGVEPYASHLADQDSGDPDVAIGDATLLQALRFGGGDTVADKAEILLRAAVAAVLNAAHPGVVSGYTVAQIQAMVNAALAGGNEREIVALAMLLDDANNAEGGCPLN
jgi:hypothetical protein